MAKNKNVYVGLTAYGSPNIDHMTVIWMGNDLPPITIMNVLKAYKDYSSSEWRKSISFFGENKNLLAATYELTENSWIRNLREELILEGCKDHSQFDWTPHTTIQMFNGDSDEPMHISIPAKITFMEPYISISGMRIHA